MKILPRNAEDVTHIPPAKQHKVTDSAKSGPVGNILDGGGENEETQLHEADKCNAKIHYLSRSLARNHGIIPAAILAGFAYKLKYHKENWWNNRWWYYDSTETLRTHRWPYFSDGCIWETTEYLTKTHLLFKDCNNKISYDRTSWYAMEDNIREAALADLVWYDVRVARLLGVAAGLIYHNLRFHLRKIVNEDPGCLIPYHRLNKPQLARALPMSQSTVKRVIKELEKSGLIIPHASKRFLYTIADTSELQQNGSTVNANGSTANANGSFTNGSTVNAIGSSVNANGSTVNANGSSMNDYTQYETNKKPLRNQSENSACLDADENTFGVRNNNGLRQNYLKHAIIHDTVASAPVPGKENTDTSLRGSEPTDFQQLIQQNTTNAAFLNSLDDSIRMTINDVTVGCCSEFIERHIAAKAILALWGATKRDQLVHELRGPFAAFIADLIKDWSGVPLSKEEIWQLIYFPQLEILIRAFSSDEVWSRKHVHTISEYRDEVLNTHLALLEKLEAEVDCSLTSNALYLSRRFCSETVMAGYREMMP